MLQCEPSVHENNSDIACSTSSLFAELCAFFLLSPLLLHVCVAEYSWLCLCIALTTTCHPCLHRRFEVRKHNLRWTLTVLGTLCNVFLHRQLGLIDINYLVGGGRLAKSGFVQCLWTHGRIASEYCSHLLQLLGQVTSWSSSCLLSLGPPQPILQTSVFGSWAHCSYCWTSPNFLVCFAHNMDVKMEDQQHDIRVLEPWEVDHPKEPPIDVQGWLSHLGDGKHSLFKCYTVN